MSKIKLILLSGLPGSGKSTLAEAVAKELKLPIFSVDPIEASIIKADIPKSFETGHAAYLVTATLAEEQFKLGQSVVIDAVNAEEEAKDVWRKLAKRHDIPLIIIECVTSDTELHKKRIESRVRNLHGIPEITWERVQNRKAAYTEWEEPTFKVDTANDLKTNITKAIYYIQEPK
jgi:predicted kinase